MRMTKRKRERMGWGGGGASKCPLDVGLKVLKVRQFFFQLSRHHLHKTGESLGGKREEEERRKNDGGG